MRIVRWVVLVVAIALTIWRIVLAVEAWQLWQGTANDPSAQELYEIDFWADVVLTVATAFSGLVIYWLLDGSLPAEPDGASGNASTDAAG